MNIYDEIHADEIEVGDQILVDGDPVEVTALQDSEDREEVIIIGYSHDFGDTVTYTVYFMERFSLWAV